jgi:hypothetical protein
MSKPRHGFGVMTSFMSIRIGLTSVHQLFDYLASTRLVESSRRTRDFEIYAATRYSSTEVLSLSTGVRFYLANSS